MDILKRINSLLRLPLKQAVPDIDPEAKQASVQEKVSSNTVEGLSTEAKTATVAEGKKLIDAGLTWENSAPQGAAKGKGDMTNEQHREITQDKPPSYSPSLPKLPAKSQEKSKGRSL